MQATPKFTEASIAAAARVLSDRIAIVCNVDEDDNWKEYGDTCLIDVRLAIAKLELAPAEKTAPKPTGDCAVCVLGIEGACYCAPAAALANKASCPNGDKCKHGDWCTEVYCQELCQFRAKGDQA